MNKIVNSSLLIILAGLLISGCRKENKQDNLKEPVWVYDTHENPYGSKPCIAGDKVIFCSFSDTIDSLHTTHCINRNTGEKIWTRNDSVTWRVSPVVYNDLVILGGINPHALNLNTGTLVWKYRNDFSPYAFYGNPLLVGDVVYFAGSLSMTKHNASTGNLIWEAEGIYLNLHNSRPVYNNGRIYWGGITEVVRSFLEENGEMEWQLVIDEPITSIPIITSNEILVGVDDEKVNAETLKCFNLADRTEKWSAEIGDVSADLAIAGDRVYAVGDTILQCRQISDGSLIWKHGLTARSVAEPLIVNGKVVIGDRHGIYCIDATNGELIWKYVTPGSDQYGFSSASLSGDQIIAACEDGKVYCFNLD